MPEKKNCLNRNTQDIYFIKVVFDDSSFHFTFMGFSVVFVVIIGPSSGKTCKKQSFNIIKGLKGWN